MKILHLMQPEKFTRGVSEFYNSYFNNGEHEICYFNKTGGASLINPDITIKQTEVYVTGSKGAIALAKKMNEYDLVVMHSMFYPSYALLCCPGLVKKIVWIAWGYDLYNWHPESKSLKSKLRIWTGNRVRNGCAAFVGIFPPDCDVFRKLFPKSKAKVFYAPYCVGKLPEVFKNYSTACNLKDRKEDGEAIYIQIGHSAVKSVNHIPVLDDLAHLKEENIRILLPLSYGDMQYADEVQQHAESIFGDKAICLREFMPADEYFALTKRVDIAIFNAARQIGLGNINRMVLRNVKLYMPKDSVMYQYFTANGVPIRKYEDLRNITFDDLKEPAEAEDKKAFHAFVAKFADMDQKVRLWKSVYDGFRESDVKGTE